MQAAECVQGCCVAAGARGVVEDGNPVGVEEGVEGLVCLVVGQIGAKVVFDPVVGQGCSPQPLDLVDVLDRYGDAVVVPDVLYCARPDVGALSVWCRVRGGGVIREGFPSGYGLGR